MKASFISWKGIISVTFGALLFSLGCEKKESVQDNDGDGIAFPGDCDDEDPAVGYDLFEGNLGSPLFEEPRYNFTDFCAGLEDTCYREVSGSVFLAHARPEDLLELYCLASVQVDVIITPNKSLTSLEGLEKLSYVTEDIEILNVDTLTSLDGFNSLSIVGRSFYLYSLNLESLEGLNAMQSVEILSIDSNPNLSDISNLLTLHRAGDIIIARNEKLCQSDAESLVSAIDEVTGDVSIYNNKDCE